MKKTLQTNKKTTMYSIKCPVCKQTIRASGKYIDVKCPICLQVFNFDEAEKVG